MELSETSGAAKRRKRRLQKETTEKTNKKITSFLVSSERSKTAKITTAPGIQNPTFSEAQTDDPDIFDTQTSRDDETVDSKGKLDEILTEVIVDSYSQTTIESDFEKNSGFVTEPSLINSTNEISINETAASIIEEASTNSTSLNEEQFIMSLLKHNYPTDIAYYQNIYLSNKIKNFIIKIGSCQPTGPFPRNDHKRAFSSVYYKTISAAGQSLPIKWLNYSKQLDCVYCLPCWLFSGKKGKNAWVTGINDWQGLSKKIKCHSQSQEHISSCLASHQWELSKTVDESLESNRKYELQFWAQVLERLFDITLMLAKNSLAFRGSREHDGNYEGNFLSMVHLLAKYDTILARVISLPKGQIKYLSHDIQDQILHCLSSKLKSELTQKINEAPFFSLIVDTTQDISKKDQMSFVVRYAAFTEVNESSEKEALRQVKIDEVFLGFFHVRDSTASGLTSSVIGQLEKLNLNMDKCRGQGYDGAAVMSGVYSGVQKRIQEMQELAVYIHCAAHNLNLVLNDAVRRVKEVANFFLILQELYIFFGHSINRWDILSSFTGESDVTLKKLNPTRWASRHESILALKLRFRDVMKTLRHISLTSSNSEEIAEANRLSKAMDSFNFVFLTVLLSKIFSQLHVSSQLLQAKNTDLQKAVRTLKTTKEELKKMREEFHKTKAEAITVAAKWNVEPEFLQKRQPKVKKHFDELAEDHRFNDSENLFKVNVFYSVLDIINSQLNNRFVALEKVVDTFSVLFPEYLLQMSDDEILEKATIIQKMYENDIGPSFPLELVSLRMGLKNEIAQCNTVFELASLVYVEFSTIASSYPEVLTAFALFLTLPVTVASAERSFSVLKRIKNYLRNSMRQERLTNLGILAINHAEAAALNKEQLIRNFAEMKNRKKDFF